MESRNGTPRKKLSRPTRLFIAVIVVFGLGSAAALITSLHRYYYPLRETAHWTISGPLGEGDRDTQWTLFFHNDSPDVGANLELFKFQRMALEVNKRVGPAYCIYHEIWVEKDDQGQYYKAREKWTKDDCTRCCARTGLPDHPDLLQEVSPYFKELPPIVKHDLRPYFKPLGYEF